MRNSIEHTLVSLDGVSTGAAIPRFAEYRDDEIRKQREHLASFFLGMVLACFL